MKFIGYSLASSGKYFVRLIHDEPENLAENVLAEGVVVEDTDIPEKPEERAGYEIQMFIEPEEPKIWFEYVEKLSVEEQINRIKSPLTPIDEYKRLDLNTAPLDEIKNLKVKELNYLCEKDILSGFTAFNGNRYGFSYTDQTNFNQRLTTLTFNPSITEVEWKTENAGIITHQKEDFVTIALTDAENHKMSRIQKYWLLKYQTLNATTAEEVDLIKW